MLESCCAAMSKFKHSLQTFFCIFCVDFIGNFVEQWKRRAESTRLVLVAKGLIKLVKILYKQTPKGRQKFVNDRRSELSAEF